MASYGRIFVLGVSRGGTTLIGAALGSHSRIAMIDEDLSGSFDNVLGGKIPGNKSCVPNLVELTKRSRWYHAFGRWNGTLRKSLFMEYAPHSSFCLEDFLAPGDTQFVLIVRHPDKVIDSIRTRERRGQRNAIYRWSRWIEVAGILNERASPTPAILDFDHFLLNPEGALRQLCTVVELPFEDAMLDAAARNDRYRQGAIDRDKAAPDQTIKYESVLRPAIVETYHRLRAQAVNRVLEPTSPAPIAPIAGVQ